jgi:outer membrane receptor protein involved in Fe transport
VNYDGGRLALDGARTSPFLIANLTSSLALTPHLRAGVIVRNLFDRSYSNPVGAEFRSPTLPQDGRKFELVLHLTR